MLVMILELLLLHATMQLMNDSQLEIREIKAVKARAQGKSIKQIGKEIYPDQKPESARVSASRLLRKATVQQAVQAEMLRQGATLEKIIKPIAKGLDAQIKTKVGETNIEYDEKGRKIEWEDKYTYEDNLPLQLSASDRAVKLLGLSAESNDPGGGSLTPEEVEALASEADEVQLTHLVFKKI